MYNGKYLKCVRRPQTGHKFVQCMTGFQVPSLIVAQIKAPRRWDYDQVFLFENT